MYFNYPEHKHVKQQKHVISRLSNVLPLPNCGEFVVKNICCGRKSCLFYRLNKTAGSANIISKLEKCLLIYCYINLRKSVLSLMVFGTVSYCLK